MNIQSGKILGIGVELGIDQTGYAKVTRVYDGSPAQDENSKCKNASEKVK